MEEEQRESRELFSSFTLGLLTYTCAHTHTLNTHFHTNTDSCCNEPKQEIAQTTFVCFVRGVKHPDKLKFKYGHCISFIYPKISSGSLCMCLKFYCNKIICHNLFKIHLFHTVYFKSTNIFFIYHLRLVHTQCTFLNIMPKLCHYFWGLYNLWIISVFKWKIFKVYLKYTCNSSTHNQIYFSISLVGLQHYVCTIKVH